MADDSVEQQSTDDLEGDALASEAGVTARFSAADNRTSYQATGTNSWLPVASTHSTRLQLSAW